MLVMQRADKERNRLLLVKSHRFNVLMISNMLPVSQIQCDTKKFVARVSHAYICIIPICDRLAQHLAVYIPTVLLVNLV